MSKFGSLLMLAYQFSENSKNTLEQLDFEWDYYNWPNP